jgi:ABC-type dipeptide/oligopeptide/nickel transport system permease subunit
MVIKNKLKFIESGGYWDLSWRQFRKSTFAMAGLIISVVLIIMAGAALLRVLPADPFAQDLDRIVQPMSARHWFGTDDLGRDLFSRIVYGSLISLQVGVGAILISLGIGLVLGSAAGYLGGWYDHLLMRITDIFLAMPTVLFAMAMLAVFEPSMKMLISVLGFLGWPYIARIIRGQILSIKEEEYVLAARALGIRDTIILLKHVLPNSLAPLMVAVTIGVAGNILAEAWLSFLGIGIPPPAPSWGRMINEGQAYLTSKPWLCIFPGVAIFITVLAFNLLGDGLRDALDPRNKMGN